MLTQQLLKEYFDYKDGMLYSRCKSGARKAVGEPAATRHLSGYYRLSVRGCLYYLHDLVFLYHTGTLPELVDHINMDPGDNRIENLRACTHSQNHYNQGKIRTRAAIASKWKGVCWDKRRNCWVACASLNKKFKFLGYYPANEEAAAAMAYNLFAAEHHGEFARFNVSEANYYE